MKVAKEGIMGLITALQIFVHEDEDEETERYRKISQRVVDAFIEVPGLEVTLMHDEFDYLVPTASITLSSEWNGPGRDELLETMLEGDPPVAIRSLGRPEEVAVEPTNLDEAEVGHGDPPPARRAAAAGEILS